MTLTKLFEEKTLSFNKKWWKERENLIEYEMLLLVANGQSQRTLHDWNWLIDTRWEVKLSGHGEGNTSCVGKEEFQNFLPLTEGKRNVRTDKFGWKMKGTMGTVRDQNENEVMQMTLAQCQLFWIWKETRSRFWSPASVDLRKERIICRLQKRLPTRIWIF